MSFYGISKLKPKKPQPKTNFDNLIVGSDEYWAEIEKLAPSDQDTQPNSKQP